MATQQVPREDWPVFFNEFSKSHLGHKASADLYGQGIFGDNAEVTLRPFGGIVYEEKGSDAHSVRVMLGDSAEDHLTHEVPSPTQVWARPQGPDEPEILEVHGSDGQRLILKFHGA